MVKRNMGEGITYFVELTNFVLLGWAPILIVQGSIYQLDPMADSRRLPYSWFESNLADPITA